VSILVEGIENDNTGDGDEEQGGDDDDDQGDNEGKDNNDDYYDDFEDNHDKMENQPKKEDKDKIPNTSQTQDVSVKIINMIQLWKFSHQGQLLTCMPRKENVMKAIVTGIVNKPANGLSS
jgi:hypothetical protein